MTTSTDPLKADSDGDGVNDKDELFAGTDPMKPMATARAPPPAPAPRNGPTATTTGCI